MDLGWLKDYIEQYFVSKRFVLLLVLIAGGMVRPEIITKDLIEMGVAFYFASRLVTDIGGDVPETTTTTTNVANTAKPA